MNTKFCFIIVTAFTGMVRAHDVPQIVREVLMHEERRNAEESKAAAFKAIRREGDAQVIIEDSKKNETKSDAFVLKKERTFFERHPRLAKVIIFYGLLAPPCFFYGLFCTGRHDPVARKPRGALNESV